MVYDGNCPPCRRRGALLWFAPRAAFTLTGAAADVTISTFHRHALQHRSCGHCGIAPSCEGVGPDGQPTAAIHVRRIPDLGSSTLKVRTADGAHF